jgi:hypothetical protein
MTDPMRVEKHLVARMPVPKFVSCSARVLTVATHHSFLKPGQDAGKQPKLASAPANRNSGRKSILSLKKS